MLCDFFFFKQKTAYEMRISDWSSDVCSSDLRHLVGCNSGILVGADVADAIAAGLNGMHLHRREIGQNICRIFQLDPVILDVLTRGEMAITPVIFARDRGKHMHLLAAERAIRLEERRVGKEGVSTCRSRW